MNVLVLHKMGNPRLRREAVRTLEYMIPENRKDLNCIVHDADIAFPDELKEIDYHLIILGPTFLCSRYNPSTLSKIQKDFNFIKSSSACKVALPQDDYDCSGILDNWMVDWGVDRIYTVCPEYWDVLYPNSIQKIEIKLGYTGYISENWINSWRFPKEFETRKIDVSYRANKLPANFGSLGQLKWEIADRFINALGNNSNLNLDISIDPKKMIPGSEWHNFMENSKFCLATPSGSSLLDKDNSIRHCVQKYLKNKPEATFKDIEQYCFPNQDGVYTFIAISPRNIEAGLAQTVQIATPGAYSGLMKPMEHFIPLNEDCSNIQEVKAYMFDTTLVSTIRKNFKETILSEPRLRTRVIVDEIIQFAEEYISKKNIPVVAFEKNTKLFADYQFALEKASKIYWDKKNSILNKKLEYIASKLGLVEVIKSFRHLLQS